MRAARAPTVRDAGGAGHRHRELSAGLVDWHLRSSSRACLPAVTGRDGHFAADFGATRCSCGRSRSLRRRVRRDWPGKDYGDCDAAQRWSGEGTRLDCSPRGGGFRPKTAEDEG